MYILTCQKRHYGIVIVTPAIGSDVAAREPTRLQFRLPLHTRPAPQHRPLSYRGFSAATPTIDLAPEPIACVWSISASISRRPIF
ncbi:hypothetical protein GW17_00044442 [Ensete ventricosum]|nr:hypothetical protein GW17_00044442 [Ensete ventricosum]